MSPIHQTIHKYRGTIVVDSNIIRDLFCPINDKHRLERKDFTAEKKKLKNPAQDKARRINHYLGVLEFLSRNGFEIIIPEMVAVETGSVLACGTNLMDYAGVPHIKRPANYNDQLSMILGKVAKEEYPNIGIVEISESDHPVLLKPQKYIEELKTVMKHDKGSREAKHALANIRRTMEYDLGEAAIIGYIQESKQVGNPNVFVLTEDRDATENIKLNCRVPVINFHGLMRPILSNGLHKMMGLSDNISSNSIMRVCKNHRASRTSGTHKPHNRWVDEQFISESQRTNEVFKRAIDELATDLDIPLDWKRKPGQEQFKS